jgi:hypothetical protein
MGYFLCGFLLVCGRFEADAGFYASLLKNAHIDEFIPFYAYHSCSVFAVHMQEDVVLRSFSTA